jgi:polyhydroxyalkanoate synthase
LAAGGEGAVLDGNGENSAAAPTNTLLGNPAALKRVLDTGGKSVVRGLSNWLSDVRHNGGMPSTAKPGVLNVGEDLAVTPGAVVGRDEVAELIQYTPSTEQVYERPTLVEPPPIGRYYFLDLAPGRSFVDYSVSRGLQTFLLSWRNPTKQQSHWDIDTYARRILTAIDEVREITGSEDVDLIGFCAGGLLNTAVLNYLSATGDERIRSAAFAVTLLDFGLSAPIGAFSSTKLQSIARGKSRRAGIIDARTMGGVFSWMRPNDLVWNYWVNNTCSARIRRYSTSCPGTPMEPISPPSCTSSSLTSSPTTRSSNEARGRSWTRRWMHPGSACRNSSPVQSTTISPHGAARTGPRSS